ncbi:hypothetical protein CSUI_008720 [Cystoisospora suis]|uniref:Transmembrane protein n=1 Tax=Cystoisospora suis TaxID=483139 RepID=A0A2C6JLQ5_9APIC|nr:hypothetical protein CSUI_008720 [Cystoisospora suis]
MARPKCFLSSVAVLALAGVLVAEGADVREERREPQRDTADVMHKIEEDFHILEDLMQGVLDIKKVVQEQTIADAQSAQRLADLDLVSFLDMLRAATTAKFELLGRLIDDIASGISRGALAIMKQNNLVEMRKKPSGTSSTTTTTRAPTTTTASTTTSTTASTSTSPTRSP